MVAISHDRFGGLHVPSPGALDVAGRHERGSRHGATLEAEPEEIETLEDGRLEVVTTPDSFGAVKDALVEAGLEPTASDVGLYPDNYARIEDVELGRRIITLVDRLEDLDDVQNVYTNADFADDIMEALHDDA